MKVTVEKPNDWLAIAKLGGPVVDPMILRCGELFLRGAAGARDAGEAWDLITKNIHALGTFFDRIILDERIPVFNYGVEWFRAPRLTERLAPLAGARSVRPRLGRFCEEGSTADKDVTQSQRLC